MIIEWEHTNDTSIGKINIIYREKEAAIKTNRDTRKCCRRTFPYSLITRATINVLKDTNATNGATDIIV